MTTAASAALIRRAAWVGLIVNLILVLIKGITGIIGHSHAVLADAVHSLSDLVTDVALIVGVRFWSAPADDGHPHGHGRIETLVTAAIGVSLAAVAVGLGHDAIRGPDGRYFAPLGQAAAPTTIALIGALVSIISKEILYRWTVGVARRCDSPALAANAWHHRSDAISSLPAVLAVGVALIHPAWAFVDRIGAALVCIFILFTALKIVRPVLAQLADRGAPHQDRVLIESLAMEVPGVSGVHGLRSRYSSGSKLQVDLHIEVDGELTVSAGHAIAHAVQSKLMGDGPGVIDVVVHVEPAPP